MDPSSERQQQQREVDMFEPSRGILEPRPDEEGAGAGAVGAQRRSPVVVGIGEVIEGTRW